MESISAFEIIKVGIGPSSSHTMGPWIAAKQFLEYLQAIDKLQNVTEITTYLYGSLAKTGHGHGTDIAIMMGLSNEDYTTIDTDKIQEKVALIKSWDTIYSLNQHKLHFNYEKNIIFEYQTSLEQHPNGMRFVAKLDGYPDIAKAYFSVGGGFVVGEDENSQAQVHLKKIITPYPCHSAQEIINYCKQLDVSISDLVFINESSWRSKEEIRNHALYIWDEIKNCIFRGVNKSGTLPGGLNVKRRANEINNKILGDMRLEDVDDWILKIKSGPQDFVTVNNWVSVFALAVNEENASFGRIITAPTNGASGVIPAVLMYAYCFLPNFNEDEIVRFIITAGEIGTLYKKGATISAAMGGCQAEIGVSSSMAAGGLAEALKGTIDQVLQAAEIAMEHHLGMTCDPIGGLVQIPCIERNCMGAIKAITATNLALGSDESTARISLDDVINSMLETAKDMNHKYKETSEGGLANISVGIAEC